MRRLAIVGAGSWGTALAIALAPRFDAVSLWARTPEGARQITVARENRRYLPGFPLPGNVDVSNNLCGTLQGAHFVLTAIPSKYLRSVAAQIRECLKPGAIVISATKGIEEGTLLRMSAVLADALGDRLAAPVVVLSGPTFAREVAAGEPAAVVVACEDRVVADNAQRFISTSNFRLYTSEDVIGVEVGAALKNVIAIGAGVCCGLGLGGNSVAALVTRGLAEITRLAVAMGGQPRTLAGLAGLGDLVLTTTGGLSRNRFVGLELGRGKSLGQVLADMTMVAEGVPTCRAAYALSERLDIDLPIINQMNEILYKNKDVREAIRELMERPLTRE
ncbi:MAG TPA: NAD(P)H-dependent glycerol-3-phosphate dehydrogenase [Bryobacteraceae bacterium]|nr:NAD(P)H-dependent glycerol-3-phosphate dehydrogenase [Bryobacteraceae bacterium]